MAHSEETKQKIAKAIKGRKNGPLSEEQKGVISALHKGREPWNKGKQGKAPWNKGRVKKDKGLIPLRTAIKDYIEEAIRETKAVEMIKKHADEWNRCDVIEIAKEMGFLPKTSAAIRQKRYRDRKKGLIPPVITKSKDRYAMELDRKINRLTKKRKLQEQRMAGLLNPL